MRLDGAVALVTGASSGIGRAVAERLAGAGVHVLAHGRDEDRLAAVAARTGATTMVADLADIAQVYGLARTAQQVAGRLDIVVNNAGIGFAGEFATMPEADVERLIATNLTGSVALARAVLPGMLSRGCGHLAFVTSIAGRVGVAGEAVYAATKGGLDMFAESLRLELHGSGVGVSVVVPGVVQTAFFARRGNPYRRAHPRPIPPEAVARAVLRGIAGGRAEAYAPRWLRLPVAVRGSTPALYRRLAARFGGAAARP